MQGITGVRLLRMKVRSGRRRTICRGIRGVG